MPVDPDSFQAAFDHLNFWTTPPEESGGMSARGNVPINVEF